MIVTQGHSYVGGASIPFFVPNSTVISGAQGAGFTNVVLTARDDVPLIQIPPANQADTSWNTFITGTYNGQTTDLALPTGVSWVQDVTPAGQATAPSALPSSTTPTAPTPPPAPAAPAPIVLAPIDVTPTVHVQPSAQQPTDPIAAAVASGIGGAAIVALGLGVAAGLFVGYQGYTRLAKSKTSSKEQKAILLVAGAVFGAFGISQLVSLGKPAST